MRGGDVHGAATLAELTRVLRGRGALARPAPAAEARRGPRGAGSGRRARPGGRPPGARGGRGGSPPPPHDRPAGLGQDDAGRAPGRTPPAPLLQEALTVTRIHSAAGCAVPDGTLLDRPPFRAPHHQSSLVSLVGGGSWSLRPGEVSLATHGVLFLDELGEFPVAALEALRQPLEEGAHPGEPSGWDRHLPGGVPPRRCHEPVPVRRRRLSRRLHLLEVARARYRRRISAPLLDRFDLVVPLSRPDPDELLWRTLRARARPPSPPAWPRHGPGRRRADEPPAVARRRRPPRRPSSARAVSAPAGCTRCRRWRGRWPPWPERTWCRLRTCPKPSPCGRVGRW